MCPRSRRPTLTWSSARDALARASVPSISRCSSNVDRVSIDVKRPLSSSSAASTTRCCCCTAATCVRSASTPRSCACAASATPRAAAAASACAVQWKGLSGAAYHNSEQHAPPPSAGNPISFARGARRSSAARSPTAAARTASPSAATGTHRGTTSAPLLRRALRHAPWRFLVPARCPLGGSRSARGGGKRGGADGAVCWLTVSGRAGMSLPHRPPPFRPRTVSGTGCAVMRLLCHARAPAVDPVQRVRLLRNAECEKERGGGPADSHQVCCCCCCNVFGVACAMRIRLDD